MTSTSFITSLASQIYLFLLNWVFNWGVMLNYMKGLWISDKVINARPNIVQQKCSTRKSNMYIISRTQQENLFPYLPELKSPAFSFSKFAIYKKRKGGKNAASQIYCFIKGLYVDLITSLMDDGLRLKWIIKPQHLVFLPQR